MSKKPNIQPFEVDSKWILDKESLPHFPAFIYDMLPPFLKEVLVNCISKDDRDMMLMGTLTCISATLHNVVGEYNHDDWHPMLYFFVMADAGMGKGSLKYCREIVAPIHYELREASEWLMKEYKEIKASPSLVRKILPISMRLHTVAHSSFPPTVVQHPSHSNWTTMEVSV